MQPLATNILIGHRTGFLDSGDSNNGDEMYDGLEMYDEEARQAKIEATAAEVARKKQEEQRRYVRDPRNKRSHFLRKEDRRLRRIIRAGRFEDFRPTRRVCDATFSSAAGGAPLWMKRERQRMGSLRRLQEELEFRVVENNFAFDVLHRLLGGVALSCRLRCPGLCRRTHRLEP